jgi:hypothetical protein
MASNHAFLMLLNPPALNSRFAIAKTRIGYKAATAQWATAQNRTGIMSSTQWAIFFS